MRLVIIANAHHIEPFNEPASKLRVLNKTLAQWQTDLLGPLTQGSTTVPDFDSIPSSGGEMLVVADNLWFDSAFLTQFVDQARKLGKPAQAAFQPDDPAFLQLGLDRLTQSFEQRSDVYYVPLWYFPAEATRRVDPIIISSGARSIKQRYGPDATDGSTPEVIWRLPQRSVCAVDTWIHLFFINIVFGIYSRAVQFEKSTSTRGFRMRARWRSMIERKPPTATSVYVRAGKNCSIDPSTVFLGPVYLGDNVTIGPGCVVSQSIIGNNVTLAQGNHVHLSVIDDNCYFPWQANAILSAFMTGSTGAQNSSIAMSVVGRDSMLGAGVIFSDTSQLSRPLQATLDYQSVDLALPRLGACVGHNCRIGAGLIVYPALSIESDVVLMPSSNRRVIMHNISYEESDHHALPDIADMHPRRYPRDYEQDQRTLESQW